MEEKDYKVSKLSNGLRIIMSHQPHLSTAAIAIFINSGSNWETKELNGIAHFLEHLFFKGTKKRPSNLILSQEWVQYGADLNAYTDQEETCYHAKVNSDHLEKIIEMFGDIISNSLYRQSDIDKERLVVINEIKQRSSLPKNKVHKLFYEKFFKSLPIAKPVIGNEENILAMKRDDILAYLYQYYRPENIVISVAGNFKSYDNLKNILENNFSKSFHNHYKSSGHRFSKSLDELINYKTEWGNALNLININKTHDIINYHKESNKGDFEHTFVLIGFPGVKYRDNDKYKASFLSMILGNDQNSRLYQTIREKYGLVYSVSSFNSYHDYNGVFKISYSCKHDKKDQLTILNLIKKEINLLKNNFITQKEYQTTLDMLQNDIKMGLDDTYSICFNYGSQLLKYENKKDIKTSQEIVDEYKKITINDLKDFAFKLFDFNKMMICTLSPNKLDENIYKKIFHQ
jgi:predicted Zn-dependent peptidase